MIAHLFELWTDGLAEALLALKQLIRPPRRFALQRAGDRLVLSSIDGVPARQIAILDTNDTSQPTQDTLRQTHGALLEIVVPHAAILERQLGVLPAESRPFLDQVVRHQIESLLPWRITDMIYATRADTLGDGRLNVSVRATTRVAINSALAWAETLRVAEIAVVDAQDPSTRLLASVGAERLTEAARGRQVARYALLGVMTPLVAMIGWMAFATWSLGDDVAALDKAIATQRAIIARKAAATEVVASNWLEAKKKESPPAVSMLDELSQIIPADTYLTELSLEGGHLRLTGVSANAAGLVPLLEGSRHFKNASFFTPTTRVAGNIGDRFSIEATATTGVEATK